MGIVLYGTTRASKPPSFQDGYGQVEVTRSGYTEMEPSQPLQRVEPQAPPAAPRLQSTVEAEEEARRQAESERAAQARTDSIAQERTPPAADSPDSGYIPAPIVPVN